MRSKAEQIHAAWGAGDQIGALRIFDDPNADLVREPFVAGAPEILEAMLAHHCIDGRNGFNLLFSPTPFPGHHAVVRLPLLDVRRDWHDPLHVVGPPKRHAVGAMTRRI